MIQLRNTIKWFFLALAVAGAFSFCRYRSGRVRIGSLKALTRNLSRAMHLPNSRRSAVDCVGLILEKRDFRIVGLVFG